MASICLHLADPRNPAEFRFRGVDGRGRQTLTRDPPGIAAPPWG